MKITKIVAAGVAMFAMLFGAGNVVFPLALGRDAGSMVWYALLGFFITAVVVPLLGLISTMLCDGDYKLFLGRMGKIPGAIVTLVCMILIGPFGVIPRCIATAHNAVKWYYPDFNVLLFSIAIAAVIFMLTMRQGKVLDVIVRFLGPLKLTLLLAIIIKGLFTHATLTPAQWSGSQAMLKGFFEGYGTLDLLGTIFFAGLILTSLRKEAEENSQINYTRLAKIGLAAGLVGAVLLGVIYTGFCLVAAFHGAQLPFVDRYELLNALAPLILGQHAGFLANVTVAVSCLVTAVALTVVFTEYLRREVFHRGISYHTALVITVAIAAVMTNFGFKGIMSIVAPVVKICYPALIVLAVVNLAHKLFGFKPVKTPVFGTLVLTLLSQWWL